MKLEDIFLSVEVNENGCWIWQKSANSPGYGQLWVGDKYYHVHRYVAEIVNGSIPKGLVVRHSCHERLCCNPKHLLVGTARDNWYDSEDAHREAAIKRRKNWKIGEEIYKTCREARDKTGLSMHTIIKHSVDGVFNIDSYRQSCKIARVEPKV